MCVTQTALLCIQAYNTTTATHCTDDRGSWSKRCEKYVYMQHAGTNVVAAVTIARAHGNNRPAHWRPHPRGHYGCYNHSLVN